MLLIHVNDFESLYQNKIISTVSLIGLEDGCIGLLGNATNEGDGVVYCLANSLKLECKKGFRSVDAAIVLISRMGVSSVTVNLTNWQPYLVRNEKRNWYQNKKNRK